jgi:hypothetical protein
MTKRDSLVIAEPKSRAVWTAMSDQTGQALNVVRTDGPIF